MTVIPPQPLEWQANAAHRRQEQPYGRFPSGWTHKKCIGYWLHSQKSQNKILWIWVSPAGNLNQNRNRLNEILVETRHSLDSGYSGVNLFHQAPSRRRANRPPRRSARRARTVFRWDSESFDAERKLAFTIS